MLSYARFSSIGRPSRCKTALPLTSAISTVTLAELAAGAHTTNDPGQRAARTVRLQTVEATLDAHPFDPEAGRTPRG